MNPSSYLIALQFLIALTELFHTLTVMNAPIYLSYAVTILNACLIITYSYIFNALFYFWHLLSNS
jgi:hypothetical protein